MRHLQLRSCEHRFHPLDRMRCLHLAFRRSRPGRGDCMYLHDGSFRIAAPARYRSGHFRR